MKIFIGGAIALLLGVFSISYYYEAFLKLMMAVIPATLILGGCLMIYLGREHFLSNQEDEPVADEPVADEPVADEPVADEPVADEPVADEPVADEPVADEQPVVETSGLVGNTDSKVFHTSNCKFAQSKKCTESFAKREDAVQAGYKPCGSCKP